MTTKTNWLDPQTTEIRSTHVAGLQEAVGKLENAVDIQTTAVTNQTLIELYIQAEDRYRIYQAVGKRNWLASPAPVIKKNGATISSGFEIDYGGGAIIFNPRLVGTDTVTADFTHTNAASGKFNNTAGHAHSGAAGDAPNVPWNNVSGKPTTFAPAAHAASHGTGQADAVTPTAIGAVANGALTPSITSGPDDSKPTPNASGRVYISTDTKKIYRDSGTWDLIGEGAPTTHAALNTHIPYAVATGSANIYAVTISPAPASYVEGLALASKINVDNTEASTINVNGLGAKSIKKPNGNDVSASNLKTGSIYSLRYNGVNFILQGSDSAGNAISAEVLSGKTFSNDSGDQTGTMPNRGTVNITPSTTNQAITSGYHSGSGVVYGDTDLIAGNIKKAVNIFGVVGTLELVETSVGDVLVVAADTEGSTSSTTYVKVKEIELTGMQGALRVVFDQRSALDAKSSYAQIYKNGVAIGTQRLRSGTTYTTYTEDFSGLAVNDKIQLYARKGEANCYYRNFRLKALVPVYNILLD